LRRVSFIPNGSDYVAKNSGGQPYCLPRGRLVSAVSVTRPEELATIHDFIATHGVTRLESRYACPTSVYLPAGIVAR
jgi:hypothetical protein